MPRMGDEQPPCIVLGIETQIGLGIVRELGAAGVAVIGITHQADAIGLSSRFLTKGVVVDAPRSEQLLSEIRSLGETHGKCFLLTVSEANMDWLSKNRERLGSVTPILPSNESLAIVMDKRRTLAAAIEVGIPVPLTIQPLSMDHVASIALSFPFPAILKWSDPNTVASTLLAHGLELLKIEYANCAEDLLASCERYRPVGCWPLIQQYHVGGGLGQFFFMRNGEAIRRFQHRRVAEWPPEGGLSSVCESIPLAEHQPLQEQSIAMLRHIGWDGVAMVEYRLDDETGIATLMEINGRFWGSFPLAVQCNAGFALLAYMTQGRGLTVALPPLREGIRCRMVSTELKRLVRIFFQPNRILDRAYRTVRSAELARFLADFVRPGVCYYVWSASDPMPFLRDFRNFLHKLMFSRSLPTASTGPQADGGN
jgi:predicted ATP-grasp superfamily ATP-dependent carboligase